MVALSPFVYWAQSERSVSLAIELKNVTSPDVRVESAAIKFSAQGVGAQGLNHYSFHLDLFSDVSQNECDGGAAPTVRVHENRVEVVLTKAKPAWWSRLTAQPQKPAWLKINFDLWQSEDAGEDSEEEKRDVMRDYPGMYDTLHKEEFGYRKEDLKKVYLILYNLFQFIGFTYVLSVMAVRYSALGDASINDTYQHVGAAFKFLQLIQFLEVMHPLFGYTKGGVVMPCLQVGGRAVVLFAMVEAEPRMQTKPVVFYLFLFWSLAEIVRYPYYISQLYKKDIYILTWLRYTIWIPLYPLGILCESIVVLRNIPYFEETQRFTVSMPNAWNFAFHMPTFMRTHLLLLAVPGLYFMMKHMYRMRVTKLTPKIVIKKSK